MKRSNLQNGFLRDLRANGGMLSDAQVRQFMQEANAVLLESSSMGSDAGQTLVFTEPVETVRAIRVQEVVPALVRAQVYLEQGLYVAGYISYEAAPAFLPVPSRDPTDVPPYLVWLGVYSAPARSRRMPTAVPARESGRRFTIGQVEPSIRKPEYLRGMEAIRRYLEAGHTYQVNYTFPVEGRWSGDGAGLYCRLRENQPVPYASVVIHDACTILSFSPELFFRLDKNTMILKPMKGTAPRGNTLEEDEANREELRRSEKDRAENRMIVDLLRNDVGRISESGSVKVRSFFDVETYPSILQATSTIEAQVEGKPALVDIFGALFPSGSVTGAPKIETMRIIHEIEPNPRGIYTGAIGYAGPDGEMVFNVAIRTLIADEDRGTFRLNVGSGVTIASEPDKEFEECLQKAAFVNRELPAFDLFETILWIPGKGFRSLPGHIQRMRRSAEYFGWRFSEKRFRECLGDLTAGPLAHAVSRPHRVRIQMNMAGSFSADAMPLEVLESRVLVGVSRRTISSKDRFQYHKTTHRQAYDIIMEEAAARGWFDAIVLNERGEVAEGARSNIFIEKDGALYTPPLSAGVLAGTMREKILASKEHPAAERTLYRPDLYEADRIFVANALRGLIEVELV